MRSRLYSDSQHSQTIKCDPQKHIGLAVLALGIAFFLLTSCLPKRDMTPRQHDHQSEKFVTLYSRDGQIIQQWENVYMIEITGSTGKFLHKGKAITINGVFVIEDR